MSSSQGNRAGTCTLGVGAPQPCPMSPTAGPALPQTAGPCDTSWKMLCHWATVGLVPLAASTPQS
ncbi:MAG: hypothetical protein ACOZQL_28625 [Myxococcota bacterium]